MLEVEHCRARARVRQKTHFLTILQAERWEVWLRDEKIAQWDFEPR